MITILICDDDVALLDVIRQQVDWEKLGIGRILTAENGEAAKRVIAAEKPQIVLSDISMPLCNGIELIRYVYEQKIGCEFAFLTCYEELCYVREAMRYGAKWYLTKPVNFPELEKELADIVSDVKQKETERLAGVKTARLAMATVLRNIRDGLYGEDPELVENALKQHQVEAGAKDAVRCVGIRFNMNKTDGEREEQKHLTQQLTRLAMQELTGSEEPDRVLIDPEESKLFLTFVFPAQKRSEKELLAGCRRYLMSCAEFFGLHPICVVGGETELFRIYSMAADVKQRLHKLRFQEGKAFLLNDELEQKAALPAVIDAEKLLQLMTGNDKADYLRYISSCISQGSRGDADAFMSRLHHGLLQACFQCILKGGISHEEVFRSDELRRADESAERSGIEMLRFSELLYSRVTALMKEKSASGDAVEIAMQFIRAHYTENIDRETVANAACVAPNYLSKLFSERAGVSLREYINQLRINEARQLLLTTSKSIGEVASLVGYDNISYFSTVFRRQTGISPAEWKSGGSVSREEG